MKKIITLILMGAMMLPSLAMATSVDRAFDQLQSQIVIAYYSGDEELVAELFSVLFELLVLGSVSQSSGGGDIEIETRSATHIEHDEAQLNADVDWDGADRAFAWFEYGEDEDDLEERTSQKTIDEDDDDFKFVIDGLEDDTRYYFRSAVEDRDTDEMYYGDIKSFRTGKRGGSSDNATVETLSAVDITLDSAVLRGEVVEGSNIEVWFAFSRTDSTPSCSTGSQHENPHGDNEYDENDRFEREMDDLREDERYYFRACAEDEDGDTISGLIRSFIIDEEGNNEKPDVDTKETDDITDESVELHGSVDMNDYDNGLVFFVWGEDKGMVESVEDEEVYDDIDEDGDDLQKTRADSDLDRAADYILDIDGLDDDTRYYYTICVEYDDEDDDETILCGSVKNFRTDD